MVADRTTETPATSSTATTADGGKNTRPQAPATVAVGLGRMASEEPLTITVRGDCMEPWLADGDRVAVQRRRLYWPGDVVAFQDRRGRLVVHRLLGWRPARGGLRLLTRADAAPRADSSTPLGRVVGRVRVPVPWSQRLRAVGRFLALSASLLGRGFRRRS